MTRYGPMFGPDITFLGVDRCDLDDPATFAGADVVVIGAPVRRRHLAPARHPVRPAGDPVHRLPRRTTARARTSRCASTGCGTCGCSTPATSRCRPATSSGRWPRSPRRSRDGRRSPARSRWCSAATTRSPWPTSPASPASTAAAGCRCVHFDAHADTGDIEFGSLYGHGQPMRRLIESGAARGDRFLQIGLRGYWPGPETLDWMAEQGMRSYEMTEIGARGLDDVPRRGVRASRSTTATACSCRSTSTSPTRGTRRAPARRSRAACPRAQLLDAVRRVCLELPVVGVDVVEVVAAVRPRRHHRGAGQPGRARGARRAHRRPARRGGLDRATRGARCSAGPSRPGEEADAMRILLVGAGGGGRRRRCGIAARRDFFEPWWSPTTTSAGPSAPSSGTPATPRFVAAQVDASDADAVAALVREHRRHPRLQRRRPALRHADLRRRRSPPAPTTSTWRCRCRGRTPSAPYEKTGVKLGDEQFAKAARVGGRRPARAGRHRRRAGPVRRVRALRRRPPVRRDRRDRRPRRRQPRRSTATTSRRRSPSGPRSRSA